MLKLLQLQKRTDCSVHIREREYFASNLTAFQDYQKEMAEIGDYDLKFDKEDPLKRSSDNPEFQKELQAKDKLLARIEKNSEELKNSLFPSE
ncbi:MAG: hypothetical protein LBO09_02825 [Candidatus Peribacteria bacterium]|jgi:hypothetical protein|nr:hypothetical protein [Candidatus Peribacteria bacterium]